MSLSMLPEMIVGSVTELSPNFLRQKGIKLLMMDFDNTLVPYTTDVPTQEVRDWLKAMLQDGFPICVVSNSRKPRVQVFCKKYDDGYFSQPSFRY